MRMAKKHPHTVLVIQLLDFHMKTCKTHTQQICLITIRHDDSLMKWMWIIMKLFMLVFVLSRLGRKKRKEGVRLCLVSGAAKVKD